MSEPKRKTDQEMAEEIRAAIDKVVPLIEAACATGLHVEAVFASSGLACDAKGHRKFGWHANVTVQRTIFV